MSAALFFRMAAAAERLAGADPIEADEAVGGPEDCVECKGTGIVSHFEWTPAGRRWVAITCWSCRGSGEAGAA